MKREMSQFWGRKVAFGRRAPALAALLAWALAGGTCLLAQVALPSCTALGGNFCLQPVGQMSGEQNVTVTAQGTGTVSSVQILTLGVTGRDFEPVNGQMTCAQAQLGSGGSPSCAESVTFNPAFPGLRTGAVVLRDSAGNVLGSAPLSGTGVGGLGVLVTGNILPVAGDGTSGVPVLDGNAANSASLNDPTGIAVDGWGNMFIADRGHNRIRKVPAATGIISTLAGSGSPGYTGDGLASTSPGVSVNAPWGVALDSLGNVYIADTGNNVVRKITAATGIITTVAGTGLSGSSGDGGPATAATLNQPQGVTVDGNGNLYIADTANHRIRRVDSTGAITTIAGNGAPGYLGDGGPALAAELNLPLAVAVDPAGNLIIPDSANNAVREVKATNGIISAGSTIITVAGTGTGGDTGDGALATQATLLTPSGVIADAAGNVYIADTGNSSIRKVSSATGFITTIARNNTGVYIYNNRGPYAISIWGPAGMFLDGGDDLYFADSLNNRIREIQSNLGFLDFTGSLVAEGAQSAPQYQTIENDGNAALDLTSVSAGNNTVLAAAPAACTVVSAGSSGSPSLEVNGSCAIGAIFAPLQAGAPLFGNVDVNGNMPNSPLETQLIGGTTDQDSTSIALTSNVNPSGFGQSVTFTATVISAGTGAPTGTVTFLDGTSALGAPVAVNSSGQASLSTAALAVGLHAIAASYGGDSSNLASTSAVLTQTVLEATSTMLASSVNPSAVGQGVTFTATVAALGGGGAAPDGTVTFTDGNATLSSVPLNAGGIATYTTAMLANGSHAIIATYTGDAAHQILVSVSSLLRQAVLVNSQCVVTSAPNPSTYGAPVTFTATLLSSGNNPPTGLVDILDAGASIGSVNLVGSTGTGTFITSSLAVGSHTITAAYQGDLSNAPSTAAAITQVVNNVVTQAQTTTTVSAFPNPGIAGMPVALTAAVQSTRSTGTPAGTVTFTDTFQGAAVALGSVPLGVSGTAALNPMMAPGAHSIVTAYGGDNGDAASVSAPLTVAVQPAATTAVLNSSTDPSAAGSAVTFAATVTGNGAMPSGSIAFASDGVSLGSAALNAKGVATLSTSALAPGTHSVTASYAGDANDAASFALAISQVVETIPTTTSLDPSTASGGTVTLTATVAGSVGPTPSGAVTFTVGTTTLGSAVLDASGVATLTPTLAAGTYTVVASYSGDALHAPSSSQAVSVAQALSAFSLSVAPTTLNMETNQSATATVTLASTGGFTDTIALSCGGLPTGVTCRFSPASAALAANGTATAQLTITTAGTVAANSSSSSASLAGLFLPFGLISGCLFVRPGRRRRSMRRSVILLLGCATLLATGCTVIHLNAKTAQAYVIQVTGTGANSNTIQSVNVTLTIGE